MIFFALVVALLLDQAWPLAPGNPVHAGLRAWAAWGRRHLDAGEEASGWLAWCLVVLGPSLLLGVLYALLWPLSSLLSFLVLVAVLYLCMGFRQFSHPFSEVRHALEIGDEAAARRLLGAWLGRDLGLVGRSELLRLLMRRGVLSAHRHVFGVLPWFVVLAWLGLGPAGALFYRLAEHLSNAWRQPVGGAQSLPAGDRLSRVAERAWQWVDHLPARMTAIGFAIVGNFEEAVAKMRGTTEGHGLGSDGVLLAATAGALRVDLTAPAESPPEAAPEAQSAPAADQAHDTLAGTPDGPDPGPQLAHLAGLVGLVWRSVVLWLLLLALLSLAQRLG